MTHIQSIFDLCPDIQSKIHKKVGEILLNNHHQKYKMVLRSIKHKDLFSELLDEVMFYWIDYNYRNPQNEWDPYYGDEDPYYGDDY
jgi:hypothetical protein